MGSTGHQGNTMMMEEESEALIQGDPILGDAGGYTCSITLVDNDKSWYRDDETPTCYVGPTQKECYIWYTLPGDLKDDTKAVITGGCGCQVSLSSSSFKYSEDKSQYGYCGDEFWVKPRTYINLLTKEMSCRRGRKWESDIRKVTAKCLNPNIDGLSR